MSEIYAAPRFGHLELLFDMNLGYLKIIRHKYGAENENVEILRIVVYTIQQTLIKNTVNADIF